MKNSFKLLLSLFFILAAQLTFAQDKMVNGTVTSESDGMPLPGVSVIVKGTSTGAQTDFDGNYSLNVNVGDVLVYSFLGMKEVELSVGTSNTYNVVLSEDAADLEEVVVVAYGQKSRKELTSAVSVLSSDELSKMSPTVSVDNMLQGKAAGVQVVAANGKPGQTAFVRIRGVGSISAGSAPLYIIDGVVAPDMSSVNPSDVESMSVLKDAATTAMYGSRAANGVILITTKSGSYNKDAEITFSSRIGQSQKIDDNFRMMDASQKLQYERELAALGVSNAVSLPGPSISTEEEYARYLGRNTNWQDELLRKGLVQSNSLSISGGKEDISYFMNIGHDRNTGIIRDLDGFERINARLNFNFKPKKWLDISTNLSVSSTSSDEPRDRNNVQNPFRAMYDYNPYETKYILDDDNNLVPDDNGDRQYNLTTNGFSISEALINNPETEYYTYIIGGVSANIHLTENLTNKLSVGGTNTRYRRESFMKPGSVLDGYVGDADAPGSKTDNGSNSLDYTITNVLKYSRTINDHHNFSVSGLVEYNERNFRSYSLSSIGFATPDLSVQSIASTPDAASTNLTTRTLFSYGGFLDYNYKGKYLFSASLRTDGSSTFGSKNRYGNFWSASAAWNIADEDFLSDSTFDILKLRASAGTSGNRNVGSYASIATLGFGSLNGQSVAAITDNGNPELGWEQNFIWDVGVEFSLLNRRLRGVFDYYQRTTEDLLLSIPLPRTSGENDGSTLSNIGEMKNKGFELELSGDIIRTKDFQFTLGGNIAFVDNEVTKLIGNEEFPDGAPINASNTTVRVGEEINTFYLVKYAGVNPANGKPLFYDLDGNVTDVYDSDALHVLSGKSPIADFDGGINTFIRYKSFDLAADFYYKFGSYALNYMQSNMLSDGTSVNANQRLDAFNYWRNPGDTNVLPSPLYGNDAQQGTDRFLQKGDYVRLRNVTLSYNLNTNVIKDFGIDSLRVYIQGQNLWTWTAEFKGDPEVGIGSGETAQTTFGEYNLYSYPQTQSFSVGVDLKF